MNGIDTEKLKIYIEKTTMGSGFRSKNGEFSEIVVEELVSCKIIS